MPPPTLDALQKLDPARAAEILMDLPFEQQQQLFRSLPIDNAARLTAEFPYYHAYVLLHSRPLAEMQAIVEAMDPADRMQFLDELPGEAWQQLADELEAEIPPKVPAAAAAAPPAPAPAEAPIIEARQIEKSFARPDGGDVQVIAPTSLAIQPGMITALLGPSGSGKSTLLRMLAGLSAPTKGEVLWHGQPIAGAGPNVAIVFQSFALFPWLTVLQNVEVPLLARAMPPAERHRRALRTLSAVGLHGFETAYPKELSGGMKQRVGFARALAVEPEVLFMDEPFSALDVLTAENLRGELMELWTGKKVPTRSVFVVTHNIEEAVLLADRIIVLGKNPARIRADFRVPLQQPRNKTAPEFLLYVDYIYKLLTRPTAEPAPPTARPAYQALPHARRGAIAGLLELLNERGKEDLYRIADDLRLDFGDLLPLVEAAALLGFARSEQGDVEITPVGKQFAEADIPGRKQLFREAALAHVTLLEQMHDALASKSDHSLPLEFFRDILEEHFTGAEVDRQLQTALNWGRYADLFSYNSETDRLVGHRGEAPAVEGAGI